MVYQSATCNLLIVRICFYSIGFGNGLKLALAATLRDTFFSIIIDETTDVQVKSQLSVIVRYWNNTNFSLVCEILDMIECESPSANGLTATVLKLLAGLEIPKKK